MVTNEFTFENRMNEKSLIVEPLTVGNMGVGQLVLAGTSYEYRDGLHPNMSAWQDTSYKHYNEFYLGKIVYLELKLQIGRKKEISKKEQLEAIRKAAASRGLKEPKPVDERPYELILNPALKIKRDYHDLCLNFETAEVFLKTEDIWSPNLELLITLCKSFPEEMKENFDLEVGSKPALMRSGKEYEPIKEKN